MINDAKLLVSFKAIEQFVFSEPLYKSGEAIRLYLGQQAVPASVGALITMPQPLFHRAFPIYTPILIRTIARTASAAMLVLAAQTACQAASPKSEFTFHFLMLKSQKRKMIFQGLSRVPNRIK